MNLVPSNLYLLRASCAATAARFARVFASLDDQTYNPVDSSPKPPGSADLNRDALRTALQFVDAHEVRHTWAKRYGGDEMGDEVVREYETFALLARKGESA